MPIEIKDGETEAEKRLILAMVKIHDAIGFYHSVSGHVSRDDVTIMADETKKAVDSVADLLWVDPK